MKKIIVSLICVAAGAATYSYCAKKQSLPVTMDVAQAAVKEVAPTKKASPQSAAGTVQVEETAATQSDVAVGAAQTMEDAKEHQKQLDTTKQSVIDYVESAVKHLQENPVDKAFDDFMHNPKFATGALYLFVYDAQATLLVHSDEPNLIWGDESKERDTQLIMAKAKAGGGWVTYEWRNATKITYVKGVQKDKKYYVIGSGFYPHSIHDEVVNMVATAADFFNDTVKAGRSPNEAFSALSYPMGKFVYGSLYLYALDFEGNIVAQGDVPGLIGQNAWDYRDAKGQLINQMIVEKLKKSPDGVWISYVSKNSVKQAYAQKVTDAQGKNYFIAAGYHPDADRKQVKELVARGYQYLKSHGITQASQEFTTTESHPFRYGDIYLFVYDMQGKCLAHGKNRDFVGKDQLNLKDEDGMLYVKEMIKKAQTPAGSGWVNAKIKRGYFSAYVERVDVGTKQYVIGAGLYAITRYETMELLVKSGKAFLQTAAPQKAFFEFGKKDGQYSRGDLTLFVLDDRGRVYAYGNDYNQIWKSVMGLKDDSGKTYIKQFINTAKSGQGNVSYTLNGIDRLAYVETLERDGVTYIIGSSLFKYQGTGVKSAPKNSPQAAAQRE